MTINLSYKNIINAKYVPHDLKVVLEVIHLLISGAFIFLFMKQIAQNSIWKLIFENVIHQCKPSSWESSTSRPSEQAKTNVLEIHFSNLYWFSLLWWSIHKIPFIFLKEFGFLNHVPSKKKKKSMYTWTVILMSSGTCHRPITSPHLCFVDISTCDYSFSQ